MREWLVAADDRTGALEIAAELAAFEGPVTVSVGRPVGGPCVVDIGSRALGADDAIAAALAVDDAPTAWTAHKIDSTLRGNWAAEVTARAERLGRAVLVIAAWPLMGRTCVGGIVHVHGRPHGDVRDHLPQAELLSAPDLPSWRGGVAVVDVADSDELAEVGRIAAGLDALVAGPAGAIGAVAAARSTARRSTPTPRRDGPIVVVGASASPVAREQLDRLAAARPEVTILRSDVPDGPLHAGAARAVADRARPLARGAATLVIVGGDTAAAVLGDDPRLVGGYAAPGMPWSTDADGGGPLVVTKAGAFGGPDALVDLLEGR